MKPVSPAAAYASMIPMLTEAAREVGYALAIHGSMARDLDVVAVPWTEDAAPAEQLILRLLAKTGTHLCDGGRGTETGEIETVRGDVGAEMPHGRRAWTLFLGNGLYIDLSVMPRRSPASGKGDAT